MFSFLEGLLLAVLGIGKNAQSAEHKTPAVGLLTYGADALAQPPGGALDPWQKKPATADKRKAEMKRTSAAHKAALKTEAIKASFDAKAGSKQAGVKSKRTQYKEIK